MLRNVLLLAVVLPLCGCALPFYDARTAGPMLEQASGLAPATLKTHASCHIGFVPSGAAKADLAAGACAHSATTLYLFSWDSTRKQYRREVQLDFASLPSFSRATSLGLTQLQLPVDGGRIVFDPGSAERFQQVMLKAGVKETPSSGYVLLNAPPAPTTIYIPVYVGG